MNEELLSKTQEELLELYNKKKEEVREKLILWIKQNQNTSQSPSSPSLNNISASANQSFSSNSGLNANTISGTAYEDKQEDEVVEDIRDKITIVEAVEDGLEIKTIDKKDLNEKQIVLIDWDNIIPDNPKVEDVDNILDQSEAEFKNNILENIDRIEELKINFQYDLDSKTPSEKPLLKDLVANMEEPSKEPAIEEEDIDFDDIEMDDDEEVGYEEEIEEEEVENNIESEQKEKNEEIEAIKQPIKDNQNEIILKEVDENGIEGEVLFIGNKIDIRKEAEPITKASINLLDFSSTLKNTINTIKEHKSVIEENPTKSKENDLNNDIDNDEITPVAP